MREQLVWILVLSLAAPAVAAAQEQKSVDPVVITATKVATPSEQIGASISVVNGDDFQTYHYPTVDEALRNVPGVEIRRSGSYGKTSSITIRGANANQVQVLVDGVRVKSPTLGQVDLSDLSPDLIERIEIIRGAQSTLYGADAIGGVVNIITRKGTGGPFQASVQQEVGNYDTLVSRATVGGAWKILNYALSASHFESNGQFQNDGTDASALSARIGATLPLNRSIPESPSTSRPSPRWTWCERKRSGSTRSSSGSGAPAASASSIGGRRVRTRASSAPLPRPSPSSSSSSSASSIGSSSPGASGWRTTASSAPPPPSAARWRS
jgi:outer membrane receptor protein involved in Fe transport